MNTIQCKIEGCSGKGRLNNNGKRYLIKGYCTKHYRRSHVFSDPFHLPKHGNRKHELFHIYTAMIQRCNNPKNNNYHKYGARGIKVCPEWQGEGGFERFISDIGDRPHGLSMDRIDNNQGYCKENFRWATPHQQASNTRKTTRHPCCFFNKNKWRVGIRVEGKRTYFGSFKSLSDAVRTRDAQDYKLGIIR